MTKREAKRIAYHRSSMALESLTGTGWPFAERDGGGYEWSEIEEKKIAIALNEIIQGLLNKGSLKSYNRTAERKTLGEIFQRRNDGEI